MKPHADNDIVFGFGRNWKNFLDKIDNLIIDQATDSIKRMLKLENLEGKRFLDVGCGSGLFSLAALKLGAAEVVSFDADRHSVECANHLNEQFGPFINWKIIEGSVLDKEWVQGLGKFDIVYSWGVLHHTGNMNSAMENIVYPVREHGMLFISLYNDQGMVSDIWKAIKKFYNYAPKLIKLIMASAYFILVIAVKSIAGLLRFQPISKWFDSTKVRGMNVWNDVVDWIGGYPFEVAKPKEVCNFFESRDFEIATLQLKQGSGCNEFVFVRK